MKYLQWALLGVVSILLGAFLAYSIVGAVILSLIVWPFSELIKLFK